MVRLLRSISEKMMYHNDTRRYVFTLKETGRCSYNPNDVGAHVASWVDVKKGDEEALQQAVATIGPIAVAIDASKKSFQVTHIENVKMTSLKGNIFRITVTLCGVFTGDRWIPLTEASDAELWLMFLWCMPEQTIE